MYTNQSFAEINAYFNKLNLDKNHFVNSNDICTPLECVKEMVDSIPKTFWQRKDIKILDSCCGNGNFHAYIRTKTKLSNLYFNEINENRIENVKKYFGDSINLTNIDFLTYSNKEKYDLVVSNPPYAKFKNNVRVSKNHNLSRDFIRKALKVTKTDGYILFIVPNNWMSYADRNILPSELSKYQFIHLNINGAKKWFPKIGSSFTWFLLQKSINRKSFTVENNYYVKDTQKVKLKTNLKFIPLYCSSIVNSITDKVINNNLPKYKIETTSFLHRFTKRHLLSKTKCSEFKYKLIHTPSQIVWSKTPHKYQDGIKVFISITNQYKTFIDSCGMTQSIAFIMCANLLEANSIQTSLNSEVFKFIVNITRYGNFNNIRILNNLTILERIKLDKNEVALIKEFNSKYYDKKK